ncbi:MAG: glutaredoxin [Hyphomonadaceae bacterium]|nr:glutaredoxin [Hyphomonadaceae bacterium]
MSQQKSAVLYRMVMDDHICPYGLKSKALLEREGYTVEDHHLTTREETDAFREKHGVKTTPQTFIDGKRIGGHDDLMKFFSKEVKDENETSYAPIIAIFSMTAAMALAVMWWGRGEVLSIRTFEMFIALSMCALAIQKLRDLEGFATQFLGYDLLAQKYVRYAKLYPFGEAVAGVLMVAGALTWLSAPIALFIGTVGAISVYKAVYIDKRELRCACVGGDSNVPLGFISLTENLMMIAMGIWMPVSMWF